MLLDKGVIFANKHFYRYVLWRIWDDRKPTLTFICLNPSTANELRNDPTVNKIMGFAGRWGYGGIYLVNLFATVSSDPGGSSRFPTRSDRKTTVTSKSTLVKANIPSRPGESMDCIWIGIYRLSSWSHRLNVWGKTSRVNRNILFTCPGVPESKT